MGYMDIFLKKDLTLNKVCGLNKGVRPIKPLAYVCTSERLLIISSNLGLTVYFRRLSTSCVFTYVGETVDGCRKGWVSKFKILVNTLPPPTLVS